MGFMAGFGPAFAKGVEKNTELREQRKDDAFKMTFAEFSKRNEQYSADKKEDQTFVRKAKAIASDKNPEAWPLVYQWVKAGLSDEQIAQKMKGEFKVGTATKGAVATPGSDSANPAAADSNPSVKKQTQAAGLVPPDPTTPVQGAPNTEAAATEAPEDSGPTGLLSSLSGKFKGGKTQPLRAEAAPGDAMVGGPTDVPAPSYAQPAAPQAEGGAMSFMRNAFGNGGGDASRNEAFSQARDTIGTNLGTSRDEVDKVFGGYQSEDPDASGISYTPAAASPEKDDLGSITQAQIAYDNAVAGGKPGEIAIAERRLNSVKSAIMFEEETKADAAGIGNIGGQPVNVYDEQGKYIGTKRVMKAAGGTLTERNPNGQGQIPLDPRYQVQTISKEERVAKGEVLKNLIKPAAEYNASLDNYVAMVRGVGGLDKVYSENPAALQSVAPKAASLLQNLANEFSAGINLADAQATANQEIDPAQAVQALEAQEKALATIVSEGPVGDLANAKALADTKRALLTYRLGMSLNQSGRNLAETERKLFGNVFDANNYPQWRQKMSDLLKDQKLALKDTSNTLNNDMGKKVFEAEWDHPLVEADADDPDERLNQYKPGEDADLDRGIGLINESKVNPIERVQKNTGTHPSQQPQAAQPPAQAQSGPPPEAIQDLKNGIGTPEQFNAIFGPGAAERILGGQ